MKAKAVRYQYRKERVARRIRGAANGLPRLCVRRSLRYFYAQVIDDQKCATLASASSMQQEGKKGACHKSIKDAQAVGRQIAARAIQAGIKQVVFDRGGNVYHGRLKALADAAREAGLKF